MKELFEMNIEVTIGEYAHSDKRRFLAKNLESAQAHALQETKEYWGEESDWQEESQCCFYVTGEMRADLNDVRPVGVDYIPDIEVGEMVEVVWIAETQSEMQKLGREIARKQFQDGLAKRITEWGFRVNNINGPSYSFEGYATEDEAVIGVGNIVRDEEANLQFSDIVGPYPKIDGEWAENWSDD